jgi:Bacterial aa3 type cytochrome c oxidase subunit IV
MADHHTADSASDMDYAQHDATYKMFVGMTKWGTIGIAVLLILMAIFLVH